MNYCRVGVKIGLIERSVAPPPRAAAPSAPPGYDSYLHMMSRPFEASEVFASPARRVIAAAQANAEVPESVDSERL